MVLTIVIVVGWVAFILGFFAGRITMVPRRRPELRFYDSNDQTGTDIRRAIAASRQRH